LKLESQVIISDDIDKTILELENLAVDETIVKIIQEKNFLVEDVKLAISKAYMTSDNKTIIILGAKVFSDVVQNRLLKIVEEPPKNKEFIIITENKSTILETITSRLPINIISYHNENIDIELDIDNLSLDLVYMFVQKHKRSNNKDTQILIQEITKRAISSDRYDIDKSALDIFSNSFIALDLGSPSPFVLSTLLIKLLKIQKR